MTESKKQNILITGASRGIGYYTALLLADNNYRVFAGVRKQEDFDKLKTINKNITPVFLDVTDENSINEAYTFITNNCEDLYAIINNAGAAFIEPVEIVSRENLKTQFDINTFAPIIIAQKFAPLIENGKVININSIASQMEIPFASAYCASKRAMEIFMNAYAKETFNKNIKFILIKPGTLKTDIWNKNPEKYKNTGYYNLLKVFYKLMDKYSSMFETPENLSRLIFKIIKSKKTKSLYYYGIDATVIKYFYWLIKPLMNIGLIVLKNKVN